MKPIAYLITNFIEKTVESKGLSLYVTSDGKYLAMDEDFNTHYKFDLIVSGSDFSCQVLTPEGEALVTRLSVNIPWTNGAALRDFMEQVRAL
ncbi:MAG: hypothetical protein GX256_06660 [Fretibacterium sp.]|nr:hypothetical protein [Fretibacterium sp.]